MAKTDLTAERARSLLHYDSETGRIFRKKDPTKALGTPSGGYLVIRVDYGLYKAHRLAWLLHTGEWPQQDVDHVNGVGCDNRFSNLRDVSRRTNLQNLKTAKKHNRAGLLGVARHGSKWRARIVTEYGVVRSGGFDTPEDAHAEYLRLKRLTHEGNTL